MLTALADLFLGAACAGCRRPAHQLCPDCRQLVGRARLLRRLEGMPVLAAADYEGPAGAIIRALKDAGAWGTARWCAVGLAEACSHLPPGMLVPVPSSPRAVRRRGFDHARSLAAHTSRLSGRDWGRALHRVEERADQAGLGTSARRGNQRGSMQAQTPPLPGTAAVLLDDVCTTGSTLVEARRALEQAGWNVVGAVVIAQARLRRPTRPRNSAPSVNS